MRTDGPASSRWTETLAAWAIPEDILAAAPEPPWAFPTELFQRRADAAVGVIASPSARIAAEGLGAGGTVLDVGAGGGAASLALAGRATRITAVDSSADALRGLAVRAERAGVPTTVVAGSWPEVAAEVGVHDVVVCHHVAYNVADLAPFVEALDGHARRRVVIELTVRHPAHALNPLWRRFHRLDRPEGPTADDALAVVRELGIAARIERWTAAPDEDPLTSEERAALVRRRLCLPVDRQDEVAAALAELPAEPARRATIWWRATGL